MQGTEEIVLELSGQVLDALTSKLFNYDHDITPHEHEGTAPWASPSAEVLIQHTSTADSSAARSNLRAGWTVLKSRSQCHLAGSLLR